MLSSVLGSARAVKINIAIMRAFVQLRGMLASHADLVAKLDALEKKCDAQFHFIFEAIRKAMEPPQREEPRTKRIGFRTGVPSSRRPELVQSRSRKKES
jgi:hypothetical protein